MSTITSRPVTLRIGSSRVTLAVSARIEPAPPPAPVIPWPTAAPPAVREEATQA